MNTPETILGVHGLMAFTIITAATYFLLHVGSVFLPKTRRNVSVRDVEQTNNIISEVRVSNLPSTSLCLHVCVFQRAETERFNSFGMFQDCDILLKILGRNTIH